MIFLLTWSLKFWAVWAPELIWNITTTNSNNNNNKNIIYQLLAAVWSLFVCWLMLTTWSNQVKNCRFYYSLVPVFMWKMTHFLPPAKLPPKLALQRAKLPAEYVLNRNPRSLEKICIAYKPAGWELETPGRNYWHKLFIERTSEWVNYIMNI